LVTLDVVKNDEEVKVLLQSAQQELDALSYTEHSFRHATIVSNMAGSILESLEYSEREVELAKIAGYLHDIGNAVNRVDHPHIGAIFAYDILKRLGMDYYEAGQVAMAIGNHDENTGSPVSIISSALILGDKSDVHRDRVRNTEIAKFDIHDRVNYAAEKSIIITDKEKGIITLDVNIDTKICPVMEYFEIFLVRMIMNRRAAAFLNVKFELLINSTKLL
jgi:metal-dependent HD superfamily phosphatase/phosphodiesterase